jgi:LmbE family N-acetylglucosaminyl deacetylase
MALMATIVFVHAHPDDESSLTAGSMARAATQGHRVVAVFATNGDHGEVPDDLADGETLVQRRAAEAAESAAALGVARLVWLGYADSGMTGWPQNDAADSLHRADPETVASRLAAVLDEEDAAVAIGYDWHGGYGHPDHIKVHQVTRRAAELARRRPRLLEATFNRDAMRRMFEQATAAGMDVGDWNPDGPADDGNPVGSPESEIHWQVDVGGWLEQRRASFRSHRSQVTDTGQMLAIPPEQFAVMFGTEHYIEPGRDAPMQPGWIV